MPAILQEIITNTKREIAQAKSEIPLSELQARIQAEKYQPKKLQGNTHPQIIAEVKPKSPSAGRLLDSQKTEVLAQTFEVNGAVALSVLTDERYFGGNLKLLQQIRQACTIPILRKEFILDEYQIWETRAAQADLILLIFKIAQENFKELLKLSLELDLQPLVEIHELWELGEIWPIVQNLKAEKKIILGINNRNLETFEVDWQHSLSLVSQLPTETLKASLSGIHTKEQSLELFRAGYDFLLIGQGAITNPKLITEIAYG